MDIHWISIVKAHTLSVGGNGAIELLCNVQTSVAVWTRPLSLACMSFIVSLCLSPVSGVKPSNSYCPAAYTWKCYCPHTAPWCLCIWTHTHTHTHTHTGSSCSLAHTHKHTHIYWLVDEKVSDCGKKNKLDDLRLTRLSPRRQCTHTHTHTQEHTLHVNKHVSSHDPASFLRTLWFHMLMFTLQPS